MVTTPRLILDLSFYSHNGVCMCVCLPTYMCICVICVCTCVFMPPFVCVHVRVLVNMYVCVYMFVTVHDQSDIMHWNRFHNFEATYLTNPGNYRELSLGTAILVGVVYVT